MEDTEQIFPSPVVSIPQIWPFKFHIKEQLKVAVFFNFCSVVLISAVGQGESATVIQIALPLEPPYCPSPLPSPLGDQSTTGLPVLYSSFSPISFCNLYSPATFLQ